MWSASSSTVISTSSREHAPCGRCRSTQPARGGDDDVDAALAARRIWRPIDAPPKTASDAHAERLASGRGRR